LSSPQHQDRLFRPSKLLANSYQVFFPEEQSNRTVKMIHSYPVPRSSLEESHGCKGPCIIYASELYVVGVISYLWAGEPRKERLICEKERDCFCFLHSIQLSSQPDLPPYIGGSWVLQRREPDHSMPSSFYVKNIYTSTPSNIFIKWYLTK
jgi:hypothetical protein